MRLNYQKLKEREKQLRKDLKVPVPPSLPSPSPAPAPAFFPSLSLSLLFSLCFSLSLFSLSLSLSLPPYRSLSFRAFFLSLSLSLSLSSLSRLSPFSLSRVWLSQAGRLSWGRAALLGQGRALVGQGRAPPLWFAPWYLATHGMRAGIQEASTPPPKANTQKRGARRLTVLCVWVQRGARVSGSTCVSCLVTTVSCAPAKEPARFACGRARACWLNVNASSLEQSKLKKKRQGRCLVA